jgi:iron-sulfur cluster repair protein YtfE (RIC family)
MSAPTHAPQERPRPDLRQLAELLNSVMRVHGPVHLELHGLPRAFAAMRAQLEAPERDAVELGRAFGALRELTGSYDAGHALCRTHRRLLEGLRALELDVQPGIGAAAPPEEVSR